MVFGFEEPEPDREKLTRKPLEHVRLALEQTIKKQSTNCLSIDFHPLLTFSLHGGGPFSMKNLRS